MIEERNTGQGNQVYTKKTGPLVMSSKKCIGPVQNIRNAKTKYFFRPVNLDQIIWKRQILNDIHVFIGNFIPCNLYMYLFRYLFNLFVIPHSVNSKSYTLTFRKIGYSFLPSSFSFIPCNFYKIFLYCIFTGVNIPSFTNFFFSQEPSDVVGYKGKSVRLPCTVVHASRGQPEITWYRDGIPIDFLSEPR